MNRSSEWFFGFFISQCYVCSLIFKFCVHSSYNSMMLEQKKEKRFSSAIKHVRWTRLLRDSLLFFMLAFLGTWMVGWVDEIGGRPRHKNLARCIRFSVLSFSIFHKAEMLDVEENKQNETHKKFRLVMFYLLFLLKYWKYSVTRCWCVCRDCPKPNDDL